MWSTATTTTTRVRALSIDEMAVAGVQGRGVTVEEGDMLCLHTGFAQLLLDAGDEPDARGLMMSTPALDGRDPLLRAWITDSGVATISADNIAVEARPATPATTPCAALPLHELCLFKLGVHLGEMWQLGPLAEWLRANGQSRFLLTAPPLRVPGAVGSPANGVATV
jgi:kynurenine formamidase